MDRRWRSQSSISINDRESGETSLTLDELLKTPPKSQFLFDNMSISISKTGLIFPSSSNNPNLFDFATNNKRHIIEEKNEDIFPSVFPSVRSKAACTSTSTSQVQYLVNMYHVPGILYLVHITRTRYIVSGTRYRLASCILYNVPRILDLHL